MRLNLNRAPPYIALIRLIPVRSRKLFFARPYVASGIVTHKSAEARRHKCKCNFNYALISPVVLASVYSQTDEIVKGVKFSQ